MNKVKCLFPNCGKSLPSSKIHKHHVTPREVDPRPSNKVVIPLCPTCHSLVYHPLAKHGQHSIKCDESIHIISTLKSTNGIAIHYLDYSDNTEKYYFPENGDTWT